MAGVLLTLAAPLVCLSCLAFLFAPDFHEEEIRRGQANLDRQLADLSAGRTKLLHLYDTKGTDALLRQIEARADVEELGLEMTDVTEAGVASVATLPRLRWLGVYGGGGFTDQALEHLQGLESLKSLTLENTPVSNGGLRPSARPAEPAPSRDQLRSAPRRAR